MHSKLFIENDSWKKSSPDGFKSMQSYEIFRWAGEASITKRIDCFWEMHQHLENMHLVDLGCGGGELLKSWLEKTTNKCTGVDVSAPSKYIIDGELSSQYRGRLNFYHLDIDTYLTKVCKLQSIEAPLIVALIGVLQNCQANPFDLLKRIIEEMRPRFLFFTCKVTYSLSQLHKFDPNHFGHSLLYGPEIEQALCCSSFQIIRKSAINFAESQESINFAYYAESKKQV